MKTFEQARAEGHRLLPAALRKIGERLESEDMVEATVLNQAADEIERLRDAISELVEVARLRGDNDLPHPADDPRLWSARMQEAWEVAGDIVDGMAPKDAVGEPAK